MAHPSPRARPTRRPPCLTKAGLPPELIGSVFPSQRRLGLPLPLLPLPKFPFLSRGRDDFHSGLVLSLLPGLETRRCGRSDFHQAVPKPGVAAEGLTPVSFRRWLRFQSFVWCFIF